VTGPPTRAAFAIALLWVAIVMFDRRALRPANRRAIRLIESEALNRTLNMFRGVVSKTRGPG